MSLNNNFIIKQNFEDILGIDTLQIWIVMSFKNCGFEKVRLYFISKTPNLAFLKTQSLKNRNAKRWKFCVLIQKRAFAWCKRLSKWALNLYINKSNSI